MDRKHKDSCNTAMTIENEAPMIFNETKAKSKKMTTVNPDSLYEKPEVSGYEFEEIANVEGWSSMDNEHCMTVNNLSH